MFELVHRGLATHLATPEEIGRIVDKAMRTNPAYGITGALIFDGKGFLQILEGDRRHVLALFHRIEQDPRMSNAACICGRAIERRSFSACSMAYLQCQRNELDAIFAARRSKDEPISDTILELLAQRTGLGSAFPGSANAEPRMLFDYVSARPW